MSALASLLGSLSVEAFFERYYPGRHLAVHASLDRLPAFFYTGLLADPRALADAYRGPIFVTNRTLGRFEIHGVEPRECFEELGLSVGMVGIEELVSGAPEWLRELEAELGMPRASGSITVFVNGPHSGLSVHCDPHEQIAIHLCGPKAFRVCPNPARFAHMKHTPGIATPAHYLAQSAEGLCDSMTLTDDAERIDLQPGSMFFNPRGLYHETLAGDRIAMTAVLAFHNPTPAELLTNYLQRVLLQSEDWRRPLDRAWSPDPARRAASRARMTDLLAQAAFRVGSLSIPLLFQSAEPGAASLEDDTRLQRDPSTRVELRDGPSGRVHLEVGLELGTGRSVACTLPGALLPLLRWLADGRAPFTLAEACRRFPDWDRAAVASAIASLVRTKALVELPFEAW